MAKVFISYRDNDTVESASRLYETLTDFFGAEHVFLDRVRIEGGTPFPPLLEKMINSSTTFLLVIGRDWLNLRDGDKTKFDYFHWEIETALQRKKRGEDIRVIPVLVEGASMPGAEDLPEVFRELVALEFVEVRPHKWKVDVKPLIDTLKRDVRTLFLYAIFGGSTAGLLAGVIVGWLYYKQSKNVEVWRIILGGFYGLFVGAVVSYLISQGVTWRSRILTRSKYSKIIGGTLAGVAGGIIAGVIGGFLFSSLNGPPLKAMHLLLAVAGSAIFITLGILLPDLKGSWRKGVLTTIILVCVTVVIPSITGWILKIKLDGLAGPLANHSPFSAGILILGSLCGLMCGFQVGVALFVYDRVEDRLGQSL